jgi:hypothetical protein
MDEYIDVWMGVWIDGYVDAWMGVWMDGHGYALLILNEL